MFAVRAAVAVAVLVSCVLPVAACAGDGGSGDAGSGGAGSGGEDGAATSGPTGRSSAGPAGPTASEWCADASATEPTTAVEAPALVEVSGLAASRTTPPVLWAHNDSGGTATLWAMDGDGAGDRPFVLDGVTALDWEDVAAGPGPGGEPYLFVADIGDNRASRGSVTVHAAPEPVVDLDGTGGAVTGVTGLAFTYADGPTDAEVLLADPVTGDLFVVAKSLLGGPVGVYRIPAETVADAVAGQVSSEPITLERVAEAPLGLGQAATGGDVSPDGSVVAIRTYGDVLLWPRGPDQTVAEALEGEPCTAPSVEEQQGEAVAFEADGGGYVTVSEGVNPPVNRFRLPGD